jgi:signal transduction histidine kinase
VKYPGKIQLGSPVLGSTSKTWMIPAGIGVTDPNNKFIGTMTIGFNINKLKTIINESLDCSDIAFALVDKNANVILKSDSFVNELDEEYIIKGINNFEKDNIKTDINRQKIKIELLKGEASSLYKMRNYPYFLFIYYKNNMFYPKIIDLFKEKIYFIIVLILISALLINIIYNRIVKPLIELSNVADRISKGEKLTRFLKKYSYEINILYFHLIKLKRLLIFEERSRKDVIKYINIANESDKARKEFIKNIQKQTSESLNTIISITDDLLNNHKRLTEEKITYYLKTILHSSLHIKNATNDVLNISCFCICDIIDQSIKIHAKLLHEKNMTMLFDSQNEKRYICADEIKIKQIILGLIARSIEYSAKGTSIQIKIEENKDEEEHKLSITIRDNSFGLTNNDRNRIELLSISSDDFDSEITLVNLEIIVNLIQLHQGDIQFEDCYGIGSLVKVTLPVYNKRNNVFSATQGENIIQFKK